MSGRERASLATAALLGVIAASIPGLARGSRADEPPTEYQIKAAFLYNFAKYVEWPRRVFATDESPFVIGVFGEDPFGPVLDATVAGKTVGRRRVVTRRVSRIPDIGTCHILFVSPSEDDRLQLILREAIPAHVLTVGESRRFCERGGAVRFYLEGSKVRFEMNPDAAARADLTISSQLLKLARVVRDGT